MWVLVHRSSCCQGQGYARCGDGVDHLLRSSVQEGSLELDGDGGRLAAWPRHRRDVRRKGRLVPAGRKRLCARRDLGSLPALVEPFEYFTSETAGKELLIEAPDGSVMRDLGTTVVPGPDAPCDGSLVRRSPCESVGPCSTADRSESGLSSRLPSPGGRLRAPRELSLWALSDVASPLVRPIPLGRRRRTRGAAVGSRSLVSRFVSAAPRLPGLERGAA